MTVDEALAEATASFCQSDVIATALATLAPEVRRLRALVAVGKECADDLAAHLDQEYEFRGRYPSMQHAYDRDMEPVRRFGALIGETPCEP